MMCMRTIKWIMLFCMMSLTQIHAAELLRDGLYLKSVQGRLISDSNEGPWWFETRSVLKDQDALVPEKTRLPLLPCSMLEVLLSDAKANADTTDLRVWAKVTKYQGKNYLFLMNYLSLIHAKSTLVDGDVDPNDPPRKNRLEIPEKVLKRMTQKPVVRTAMPKEATILLNKIVINRCGYIETKDKITCFVFDGLGYSFKHNAVEILPCEALDGIKAIESSGIGPFRFSVAGMTTTFRGKSYIYLQRAHRIFSHGNFGQRK